MNDVTIVNARPVLEREGHLQEDMMEAVIQLQVAQPMCGRGSAEIMLVNWGRREGETGFQWLDVSLGDSFDIAFFDSDQRVFGGEITAIEERYGYGAPMLVLLLEDPLHRLAKQRRSAVYERQTPDDVINSLVSGLDLSSDVSVSSATGDWHQLNETDYNFIRRIAGRWDIAVRISGGTLRIKPEEADAEPAPVSPQSNARTVRIIADLNHQATATGLRGWNFQDGTSIEDEADSLHPAPPDPTAAEALESLGWGQQEWLGRPHPRSPDEARDWSRAAFAKQANRFLHGDLVLDGDPALRAGGEIELSEVSSRLQGRYRISHLAHRFDRENGFVSRLQVQRPDWGEEA